MKVGCLQVVILVMVRLMVSLFTMVCVTQHIGAHKVHYQSDAGHHNGFVKMDLNRAHQTFGRLPKHDNSHDSQNHCTGITSQHTHLSRSKGVGRIIGIPSRIGIGKDRDAQGPCMGAHVPAISQKGHGAEDISTDHFHHHHGEREDDDPVGLAFRTAIHICVKMVLVLVAFYIKDMRHISSQSSTEHRQNDGHGRPLARFAI